MFSFRAPLALLACGLLAATPVLAQSGPIEIQNVWSRAAMAGRNGAVFLTIVDNGAPDRLVSAASPVADKVEVHETIMDGGVMKMRQVHGLDVAPGAPVTLAPGGHHIMLLNLKRPLADGDHIPLTLTFEKAGSVSVIAMVGKAGAAAPSGMHQHGGSTPK